MERVKLGRKPPPIAVYTRIAWNHPSEGGDTIGIEPSGYLREINELHAKN
jgi:hypothetical protein